jgi:hypothetical protein
MNKLPVAESIIESVKFPITHFGALFRRTGLIGVVLLATGIFFSPYLAEQQLGAIGTPDQGQSFSLMMLFSLFLLVFVYSNFLLGSIQVYCEHAFGKKLFSFGSRELRFLLLIPLNLAIGMIALVVLILVGLILGGIFGTSSGSEANREIVGASTFFAMLGYFVFWIICAVRLSPLFGFIAIENRFAVRDAWRASKGNFWRIAITMILLSIVVSTLMIPGYIVGALMFPLDLEALGQIDTQSPDAVLLVATELFASMQKWSYFVLPFAIYGYFVIAIAFGKVYFTLTQKSKSQVDEEKIEPMLR